MQTDINAYHPHRHWNSAPATVPQLDAEDAKADQEDSLSLRYAFLLGQDVGRCRMKAVSAWPSEAMGRGYKEGLRQHAHVADAYLRKLLGLRVNAFARDIPVSSAITVDFIRSVDVPVCPVSGVVLTRATQQPTDWSIERLDNNLGYVPGNVCVVAKRVNALKGALTIEELLGHAALMMRIHAGDIDAGDHEQLSAVEALRLASLAAGPSGWAAGKLNNLPPLATAPGVWGTPAGNIAIIHVACARSRLEGGCRQLRAQWFKSLGSSVWRTSNRLVRDLQGQFSSAQHPCDVWFEPEIAGGLQELLQALIDNAGRDVPSVQLQSAATSLVAVTQPIQCFRRLHC